ncbi:MAG: hypothetical protein A2887_06835 [Alphaproteobacteria bacterium RIFCSPLOWO2_01_FULL_40_26]|nr:MAG: hypothetical protein A3D15_06525 [Alphaproteobacteria bacterium RIFCSPHIGHO2_02_FULL_40_34]OFW85376.1 MAG: hypothetical protein A2794_02565 [Alphaproteobacteria bacterium RIFCSPHIGHO2_01_FULL_40_8]OFW95421.1 MAG: hypothetical protein A2887_06835 [Alphaproteobacteria bacterium RIFCSPLOWO2_01_FULL_40_26]OFX10060.1 MAG: hypothetical protein A3H30_04550 [Alphaproteobacteria bacterium RIFCSPLOWO2_02_FULL_40_19]OFX11693.1 MAG: hypothetical protein A3G22_04145 [Alphaproteobacteria bacterium RI
MTENITLKNLDQKISEVAKKDREEEVEMLEDMRRAELKRMVKAESVDKDGERKNEKESLVIAEVPSPSPRLREREVKPMPLFSSDVGVDRF